MLYCLADNSFIYAISMHFTYALQLNKTTTAAANTKDHTRFPFAKTIDLISYLGLSTSYANDSAHTIKRSIVAHLLAGYICFGAQRIYIVWSCVALKFYFMPGFRLLLILIFVRCLAFCCLYSSLCPPNGHIYLLQRVPHWTIKVQFSKTQLFISIALTATSESWIN